MLIGMHEGTSMQCTLSLLTFEITFPVLLNACFLFFTPINTWVRRILLQVFSIYLSYLMNTEFHKNYPNFTKYIKDKKFVLEDDSVIAFCVFESANCDEKLIYPSVHQISLLSPSRPCSSLWECFPVIMMILINFLTLKNALTVF